jgi:hypothetical protein
MPLAPEMLAKLTPPLPLLPLLPLLTVLPLLAPLALIVGNNLTSRMPSPPGDTLLGAGIDDVGTVRVHSSGPLPLTT